MKKPLFQNEVAPEPEGATADDVLALLVARGYRRTWDGVMERHIHMRDVPTIEGLVRRVEFEVREHRKGLPLPVFEAAIVFEAVEGHWIQHLFYGFSYADLCARLPLLEVQAVEVAQTYGKKREEYAE